jgi:hypothetical protein
MHTDKDNKRRRKRGFMVVVNMSYTALRRTIFWNLLV